VIRADLLLLALVMLHALLGGLCLAIGRGERYSGALRLWGWGLLIHGAGILIALVFATPAAAGTVVGNSLIAGAPVFYLTSALIHTRVRLRQRWLAAAGFASVIPVLIAYVLPNPWLAAGVLAPTPVAVALMLAAAWVLARNPPAKAAVPARLTAYAFALAAGAWALRILIVAPPAGGADGGGADLAGALVSIAQMVTTVAATFGLLWIEIKKMESSLERFANADSLTGLPNARAAMLHFRDELARAARHERTFALVLLDIDRFTQIRDMRGERAGDAVIRHVADTLRGAIRGEDALSRLGGEAFAVLLPEQAAEGGAATIDRLRKIVAATPCRYDAWPLTITISGAVAVCPTDGRDWHTLFTIADRRLRAARAG
jgi:diguanylate cyclase (GGDEF)-like protein